ncbi:MAG: outer membrane lipoprotein-sorting protein, partial [bacterium]
AVGSGQWAVGSGQWAVGSKPEGRWLLSTLYCLLLTAHCLLSTAYCLAATAQTNETGESTTTAVAELPGVDELMANLLARLPAKPITLTGELVTTSENDQKSKLNIIIQLRYPQEATYTLCDTFGKSLEQLTVTRKKGITSYRYLSGDPLTQAAVPRQDVRIRNTALSWMDLTLGFLWWDGGKIIGRVEARGQPCYLLDRRAPQDDMAPYARVQLWVDTRISMLIQADGYDKMENLFRRLSIKSFKKINHEWMIKDLEVEDLASHTSTLLRIRDAEGAKTPET